MPLYEYRCGKCDEKFDVLVRKSDQKIECPACGEKRAVEKIFSVFGVGGGGGGSGGSSSKSSWCAPSGGG